MIKHFGLFVLFQTTVLANKLGHDLTSLEMILEAGYPAEQHKITTDDCYKITLHRIPGPGKPVFLQHGLVDSSAAWLIAGTDHGGLAFRLAEAGYDVWLGNFRGNTYSRAHCTMNPDDDQDYWKFTWDEMAKYDLPSSLNFVLSHTGYEKLLYVGHSMGSTSFMVMNSLDQSWADRIELATFLAPVAYVDHMLSPIRIIAPFAWAVEWITEFLGLGEFIPSNGFMDLLAEVACDEGSWLQDVCENVVFLLCGYDKPQMNETMLSTIVNHIPAGASTYTILHYAQGVNTKEFMGFDWGNDEDNEAHHGQKEPPLYNLENVNAKVALYWGDGDWLAQPGDLIKIVSSLPNIVVNHQIEWAGWNHLDFMYAIDVDQYINFPLLEMFENLEK